MFVAADIGHLIRLAGPLAGVRPASGFRVGLCDAAAAAAPGGGRLSKNKRGATVRTDSQAASSDHWQGVESSPPPSNKMRRLGEEQFSVQTLVRAVVSPPQKRLKVSMPAGR